MSLLQSLKPSAFRNLVSGRRRGAWAALLRGGLRVAEVPYTWAVRWRNHRYATGAAAVYRVGATVLSVGNLTLGGTGKTPMVEWLARWFADRQISVAVVSRGYGAPKKGGTPLNDEARELAWRLPGVPQVQDPDRVAAARRAIDEFHCRLVLLDDGFQHRRIARDLDIVLVDALEPLGFGHVFPRGTLREPPDGLGRADIVALSRADVLAPDQRAEIRRQVRRHAPRAQWLELAHAPRGLVALGPPKLGGRARPLNEVRPLSVGPLDALAGQRVLAFCGIGNPAGFRHTLAACNCQVAEFLEFPDHHAYTAGDLDRLSAAAQRVDAAALVCTEKDLVKLAVDRLGERPLWAVRIGLEILAGREALEARLAALPL
jgi:tetraacyldisaccharide 4'-kinase